MEANCNLEETCFFIKGGIKYNWRKKRQDLSDLKNNSLRKFQDKTTERQRTKTKNKMTDKLTFFVK
jgi:hypothetical protein